MVWAQQGGGAFMVCLLLRVCSERVCVCAHMLVGPRVQGAIDLFIRNESVCVCVCMFRCGHLCVCLEASFHETVTSFTCVHLEIFFFLFLLQ